jgi:competence protein ComEC
MLGMVALLVFVSNPISLMMPGFKLSFAAVVVLLWFAKGYWRATTGKRLVQLTVMQCTLLLGLMPLTILIFQRVAVVAPLVNIITVPVFSLVTVPLMIASMVLYPLSVSASNFLLDTSAASIQLIQRLINAFAQLPFADVHISGVDGFGGTIACIVLLPVLWVVLPRGWPGRWVAMLAVISLLVHQPATPPRRCFDTHVLDVGQGLAVVVQTQQKTLVFDTGPSYRNNGSAATAVVLPFLRYKGISELDWLVISHSDDDHAGGVPDFDGSIEMGKVFAGEPLRNSELDTNKCVAGQTWQADEVEFAFIHPGAGHVRSGNDSSCVLTISAGSHRLVLTGDIEKEGERLALTRMQQGGSTVVVIPHHGSLTSSSPRFVNHLRPEIAIASAGYANRWGFPKQRVTRRWEGVGATVLDTGRSGAISLRLCSNGGVTRMREERVWDRRFWHDLASL